MKQPLLIIAGPTASGKTALSVQMAKDLNGEVISADSMQVYRGMDIGTAKVKPEEMQGVPHHLIDICDPDEEWNVARFCRKAREAADDIWSRGRLPILCGGTGFYIHAFAYGADFAEEATDGPLRRQLEELSSDQLHRQLALLDPESAASIHPNNRKRVIRALEYTMDTGEKFSAYNKRLHDKPSPYQLCFLVLNMDRQKLYDRIDVRVDQMLSDGLVEEVRGLKERGMTQDMVSMKGLGYKEILAYLDGQTSLEEAVYILKRDTRHFAKRQLTWLRAEKDAVLVDREPVETLVERAEKIAREKFEKN